ncbi:LUD domain-containing protein [Ruficoccus amylovorans]|uniref:LUD domain-containing protein n=1 Tax=Ruficoccus amylovorans TaxID=1804625 RepID=A0A842HBG8_9BACT|nr:LUD domain-containing protein [Ruficoccus amylovorans]MBC2593620.1 LUD domain-containing protein [Ruficoccus amylovorans]
MQDDRELVMSRIREALAPLKERAQYPEYDPELPVCRAHPEFADDWELFSHKMKQVNGTPLKGLDALGQWLAQQGFKLGYCDPALVETVRAHPAFAGITLETTFERSRVDDYTFGITQASGAIAETGSIVLKDSETSSRLGALAPWTHIAILKRARLYPDSITAISHFGDDPSIIWATGPSKTADVEGILIEGVHGPGVQVCCLLD